MAAIVAARHERRTAWAIATRLQVPRSTVAAVLVRVGLNRLAHLTPRGPVIRYERTRPGELVHLDIKPLARILRVGHRIHGDRRQIVEGAGYEYAHVAVDDYSRVAYVEVLPDQRGGTTAAFLRRTVGWFARRGVTVERVLTDNGSAYVLGGLRARRAPRPGPADPQPTASSADQREGRTIHSDADSRLGLCRGVSQLVAPDARPSPMAPALQRRAASRRPRISTAVRPLSEGRPMINLVRSHN